MRTGAISPTIAGDLNAIAGTLPNVTLTPTGISILGSDPASTLTTLNGMNLSGGSIPRAARTETRVTGTTYDATRGGFTGANVDVRLGPGSRSYERQNGFVTFDPRSLQYTDPTTRSLGNTSGGVRASFGADGELIRRAVTYNVAIDLARSTADAATLFRAFRGRDPSVERICRQQLHATGHGEREEHRAPGTGAGVDQRGQLVLREQVEQS